MKILVIGSGGREHALVWKIRQNPKVKEIFCAPGNGGICDIAQCVDIPVDDLEGLLKFAQKNKIDLTVVGPESPLASGIVDLFEKKNLKIFGPRKDAAQLEGSKVFAKEFMKRHEIPTAGFRSFESLTEAQTFIKKERFPLVVKADGLAGGKGVVICNSLKEAEAALLDIMDKKIFKEAGKKVVIEEYLKGEEASILAVSDGVDFVMLDSSQDHKRIFDGDIGPNTGGMGAYSPAPIITQSLKREIGTTIIKPVIDGMRKEGKPFKGILYAGLMIADDWPRVLEFNVRFGDPETQVLLPRLKNDLVDLMFASCSGQLKGTRLQWDSRSSVCVVMSSRGYPGEYEKGKEITGLNQVKDSQTIVFHAGTKREGNKILSWGGRVLSVTSLGDEIEEAIERVYAYTDKIKFDGCFFRRDIALKALKGRDTGIRRLKRSGV